MILDIAPCPKPRMTARDRWKKRQCVVKYFAFRDQIRQKVPSIFYSNHYGYCLDLVFLVQMPKSWSEKKKAEFAGMPHQQKPDLDNYIKGLLDAMYKEDKLVWSISAKKLWTTGKGKIEVNFKEKK